MLKISIVIPVYNVGSYLSLCIESVLRQTFFDVEIILVDDGSPDNSSVMCDECASRDNRIKVIHKNNGGLSSARLAGFDTATGDYVLFIDSDDTIEEKMVEKLLSAIQSQNADMAMCGYYTVRDGIKEAHMLPYNSSVLENVREQYIEPLIGEDSTGINIPGFLWLRMMKKDLIQRDYFVSEGKYYAEDIVFDLQYARGITKIAIVNEPLYDYYINESSLTLRHRKDKWGMLCNLYNFRKEYCIAQGINTCDGRLQASLGGILFAGIDNAVRTGSYQSFVDELRNCLHRPEAPEVMEATSQMDLSKMQKLEMMLLKSKMYRMLYLIRKSRMGL